MNTTDWHASRDVLERFATAPASLDHVVAASLEQHLLGCASCRADVARLTPAEVTAASWARVAEIVDRPRPSVVERVVRRLGASDGGARLVAATAALRWALLVTVVGVAGLAVLAARARNSTGPFLVVAPAVPPLVVLLGFLPTSDPSGEAGTATPLHGVRLLLQRVLAVLVPAVVLVGLATLAVPQTAVAVRWLVPGLALAGATMAAASFVRVEVAASTLLVLWWTGLGAMVWWRSAAPVEAAFPFRPAGAATCLVVLAVSAGVVRARRDRFSTMEVAW